MKSVSAVFPVILKYLLLCLAGGVLLYDNWRAAIILLPGFVLYYRSWKKKEEQELAYQRAAQFRDALTSLGACLEAGYAMENAVLAAQHDLEGMYPEQSWIRQELAGIGRAIANSVPAEEAFLKFATRSGLEDAESFAELYATAKKSGGDLLAIIRATVSVVSDKVQVRREIHTILTAKQLECKIMRMIPPGILIYFRIFSPGFLDMLYEGIFGKVVMTVLFLAYLFLAWLMGKMVEVEL